MANTLKYAGGRNTNLRGANLSHIFNFRIVTLLCGLLLAFGCEEPAKTPGGASIPKPKDNPTSAAMRILIGSLGDLDPQMRANAIEVVAATKHIRLMPKVERLLKDEFSPVRFLAALAVGDMQYSLATDDMIPLLKDPDQNVQMATAYAMYKLGHSEYLPVFRNAIASEDQTVRANAALLLGKSGDKSALKYLRWALQRKDSDDRVVLQAAEAIAMLGDEQIYPKLWTRLISAYADDRVIGISAMGALGTEQAKNALFTMLEDPVLEVRLAAAEQLGKLNDPVGEIEVKRVFEQNVLANMDEMGQERVKVLAALAIGEIGTKTLTDHLPDLLKDRSKFVRLAAAKAVFRAAMKR